MKKLLITSIAITLISCSDKEIKNQNVSDETTTKITYDTTAIDSFGPGATAVGVMAKINRIAEKRRADSLAAIAKAEQDKLDKEKLEKDKKLEEEKKAKEKKQAEQKVESTPVVEAAVTQ